jgi:hypothetical protein
MVADALLGVDVQLGAEAAAHVGGDHADLGLADVEGEGQQHLEDVRDLGGRPDGVLALGGDRLDDHAPGLDRVGDQPRVVVALLDHHRGLGEHLVDVAVGQHPGVGLVGAERVVDDGRALVHGLHHVGDHRQLVVVDFDGLDGVGGVLAAVGHHHGDDLAHVVDAVLGHRPVVGDAGVGGRLVGHDAVGDRPGARHGRRPLVGQVLTGEHRLDPRQLLGRRGVDAGDAGVGDRAAHEGQPQHARQGDVVDVAALAGEQRGVLLAEEAAAHPALGLRLGYLRHSDPPWTPAGAAWRIWPAASWMALTMFW